MTEEFLNNLNLPQKDSGLGRGHHTTKGFLYIKKGQHYLIVFDALGKAMNILTPPADAIKFSLTEFNLAFVSVEFYDIFMIIEPLITTTLEKKTRSHFDDCFEIDKNFLKTMYDKFEEKNEIKNLN